jgi:GNAT superfamily N-acetyltransferase
MFRNASSTDLPAIITLLADDPIGATREVASKEMDQAYLEAFAAIEADPNQLLAVAVDDDGKVIGCLQLSFIPGLSRKGMWRGQIESVRIAASHRGGGLGAAMIEWAVEQAKEKGCGLVQLTSDNRRPDAIRFYERQGFVASHEGLKLDLS